MGLATRLGIRSLLVSFVETTLFVAFSAAYFAAFVHYGQMRDQVVGALAFCLIVTVYWDTAGEDRQAHTIELRAFALTIAAAAVAGAAYWEICHGGLSSLARSYQAIFSAGQ